MSPLKGVAVKNGLFDEPDAEHHERASHERADVRLRHPNKVKPSSEPDQHHRNGDERDPDGDSGPELASEATSEREPDRRQRPPFDSKAHRGRRQGTSKGGPRPRHPVPHVGRQQALRHEERRHQSDGQKQEAHRAPARAPGLLLVEEERTHRPMPYEAGGDRLQRAKRVF